MAISRWKAGIAGVMSRWVVLGWLVGSDTQAIGWWSSYEAVVAVGFVQPGMARLAE